MNICPLCNSEYDSRIEYCFRDGTKLDSSASSSSSSTQKLATSHLDSMGKHSMDSMETLDNISIHDLLQIGGGGFQGFGEFTPIEAPPSEEGNTMIASRSELQAKLEQSSESESIQEETDDRTEDIENILDSLGGDIGAHLDDTLDGIQVGQILDDSSLDMGDSNEILPGDTLDVLVDELDVPHMTESDLNRFHEGSIPDFDGLDAWEASGPIMQEAARNALAQHRMRSDEKSSTNTTDTVNVQATDKKERLPIPMLVGGILLLLGGGIWAMSGDSDTVDLPEDTVADVATPEIPVVPKVPVMTVKEAKEPADENPVEEPPNPSENIEQDKEEDKPRVDTKDSQQAKEAPKPSVNPKVPTQSSNANTESNGTSSKPVTKPKPKPEKRTAPPKPKTKPKPIPQKDPQEDNSWGAVQSGGWGASTCAVRVNSNVSSAKVYIDGQQKGSVGKKLTVDCGEHKMEVRSEGYKSVSRNIDLMGEASFTIDLSR